MSVKDVGGRMVSERTPDEIANLLKRDFHNLTKEEQEAVLLCLEDLQNSADQGSEPHLYSALSDAEYVREPVDIETFIKDEYYLGKTCDSLYPILMEDMRELFSGGYREVIMTGSLGYGKCLHPDAEVYDVGRGRRERVGDAADLQLPSMEESGAISPREATCFPSGKKRCVSVSLADGKRITLSNDHPVFTARGWVEAAKLLPEDLVATPRRVPEPLSGPDVSDDVVKLVAYLLADGGCTGPTTFTNENPKILDEFEKLVMRLGDVSEYDKKNQHIRPGVKEVKDSNSGAAITLRASGIRTLVTRYGCEKKATDKRVPAEFYGLPREQIAMFLNRFLACDGYVYAKSPRRIEVGLGSEDMIDDLAFLLLRLGIHSYKYYKRTSYKKDGERREFDSWKLQISGRDELLKFFDEVGLITGKEGACAEIKNQCLSVKSNPNADVVPVGLDELREIRGELGDEGVGLTGRFRCPRGQLFSRQRFERLCGETGYKGKYAWHASSDIIWSRVREVKDVGVHEVYDLTVPETHNLVANGIVVHNTFFSSIAACRVLYELSCLKDPHKSLGISKGSDITFICLSAKEDLAIKVAFENIISKIKESQYFKDHFPFKALKKEIHFPNNIQIAARASTDSAALGLNVFSAFMDEGNFMPPMKKKDSAEKQAVDRAKFLYDQLVRRMKSRFQKGGKLPGLMIVVSSKQTKDDFTKKRILEAKDDPTVFVRDYATWHVKPQAFSGDWFQVLVGNELIPSKILDPSEVEPTREKLQDGMLIVDVPEDFRKDFEDDLEGALRDIAGVETVSISPFIQQIDKIIPCIDKNREHPFTTEEWVHGESGRMQWTKIAHQTETKDGAEIVRAWEPKFYPGSPRYVHIDISLNEDATGFAMGCITGFKHVERKDENNEKFIEPAPVIWVDLILRIKPPIGGEIDHGDVRGLVYQAQKHGFHVACVSMDQWNSVSSLQKFATKGISTEKISVDKPMDAYETLKSAIYENRVFFYKYQPLLEELKTIQKDSIKNKVDHPPSSSKDLADALAGVVYNLTVNYKGPPMGVIKGMKKHNDPVTQEQDEMVQHENDFLMPFVQG